MEKAISSLANANILIMRASENRGLKERKLRKKIICGFVAMFILLSIASPVFGEKNKEVREPLNIAASCEDGYVKITVVSSVLYWDRIKIEFGEQEIKSKIFMWPGRELVFNMPVSNREDEKYDIEIEYNYKGNEITVDREVFCKGITPPEDSTEIPEFPTVAMPIAAVIGLMFVFQRKKNKQN